MKKIASVLAIGMALASASAFASDGTITINGEVSAVTCAINGNNSGGPSFAVNLPKVSANAFHGIDSTAGRTEFQIKLSGCTNSTGKYVRAFFEPSTTVFFATGYLKNQATGSGAATGVAVKLSNGRGAFINPNLELEDQQSMYLDGESVSSGSATLRYFAEYVANTTGGAVTPGSVLASIVYDLHYW